MSVSFPTAADQLELPDDWNEPEVEGILEGAVDLHVHPFPSPFPRRMGILEATRDAARAKYRAIVVKSHHHSMVPDVLALHEGGLGDLPVQVFGGVALNPYVGGLNPYAVDLALNLGGRIVWFPTISSPAHIAHTEGGGSFPSSTIRLRPLTPLSILDENGSLKPEVPEILSIIKEHDAILTGGHLPANEIDVLFNEALRMGLQRIMVNHPNFIVGATPELVGEWARKGVYVEHSVVMYGDAFGSKEPSFELSVLQDYIKAAGVGRTMLVSDTGQKGNPRPVDVIRVTVRDLLRAGHSADDLQRMTGGNAGELLLG